jgi:riboflavin synthase alpha subunit
VATDMSETIVLGMSDTAMGDHVNVEGICLVAHEVATATYY